MKPVADPVQKTDRYYTYGDYKQWPEDERWELIDGVAWNMSPAPSRHHQGIVGYLFNAFYNALNGGPCFVYDSPFDVLLPDKFGMSEDEVGTVVQPDVLVACDPSILTDAGATGAPTLIIEVLSPYTAAKDMGIKRDLYRRHGVKELWIVDSGNRYIHVWILDETGKYPAAPVIYTDPGHASISPSIEDLTDECIEIALAELFSSGTSTNRY